MADLFSIDTSALDLSSSSCRGLEKKNYCLVERDDISFDRALQNPRAPLSEYKFQKGECLADNMLQDKGNGV